MSDVIDRALRLAMATTGELQEAAERLKVRLPPSTGIEQTWCDFDGSIRAFCEVRDELKRRGEWR